MLYSAYLLAFTVFTTHFMKLFNSFLSFAVWLSISIATAIGLSFTGVYLYLGPSLPAVDELKDIDLQTPLRIYTFDGKLISEIGEKRRNPLSYEEIPPAFIDALLASEDSSFFEHSGIDLKGLARAVIILASTGEKRVGGSTITMQVAKNYYLSSEKSFTRKFTEILLALKIEQELSKEEILELYVNKIYLGKRAYGIDAAAHVYFGKPIKQLSLAQLAMIAGLPQAPSAANPINNPTRALARREYVLNRMLSLEMISPEEFSEANSEPLSASYHGSASDVTAPYITEMVRQEMVSRYGDDAYIKGYRVFTTVESERQIAANNALQNGLLSYDRDHGWRKPTKFVDFIYTDDSTTIDWDLTFERWQKELANRSSIGLISPAIVSRIEKDGAWLYTRSGEQWITFESILWAKRYINQDIVDAEPKSVDEVLSPGMEVWVKNTNSGVALAQLPEVEGALVSINPKDGSIQALVGGFSTLSNQFNRAIQAERQPGSAFNPFVYSAALANGYTPATIINDAPVVFNDATLESTWRPQNNSGKFYGPTRLREALYRSQNLVSIRILNQIGPHTAIRFMEPFGFPRSKLNADLSLALGASAITSMELATGYAVLANGGYAVTPYLISHIEDDKGNLLYEAEPATVCPNCNEQNSQQDIADQDTNNDDLLFLPGESMQPTNIAPRILDERIQFLMVSMLKDVVNRGTGRRALALKRDDLAGKTGTTNDQKDAWFAGFNPDLVTTVWVGFDQNRSLGRWAFGANTALPIWVDYMSTALKGVPEHPFEQPAGVVSVRIDPVTGLLAAPGQKDAIFEFFREENVPSESARIITNDESDGDTTAIPEQLF